MMLCCRGHEADVKKLAEPSRDLLVLASNLCSAQEVETIVKASVATPDAGGQNHVVLGVKRVCPDDPTPSASQEGAVSVRDAGGRGEWLLLEFCWVLIHLWFLFLAESKHMESSGPHSWICSAGRSLIVAEF